jgi:CYTH domain-containing protein
MNFEIERKFLVRSDAWQDLATGHTSIRQAYLTTDGKSSIRVRIKGNGAATLASNRGVRRFAGWSSSLPFRPWMPRRSCRSGKAPSSRRCAT